MRDLLYRFCRVVRYPVDFIIENRLAREIEKAFKTGFDLCKLSSFMYFKKWLRVTESTHKDMSSQEALCYHISSMGISNKESRRSLNDKLTNRNFIVYRRGNTGGSTGEPLTFEYGLSTGVVERGHQQFLYSLYGVRRSKARIISFSGYRPSSKELERNVFWRKRMSQFPYGRYDMSSLNISRETIHAYANKYVSYHPNIVRGYPSAIASFVELCRLEDIKIQEPKIVLLTSEQISEAHIKTIRQLWSCPIIKQYGMSEACAFGFSFHNYSGYYISPFYGITEVLDRDGKHVKVGETGQIVVTGFGNTRQPFLRYETGDLAIYDGEYNGFVKLLELNGRTADYIVAMNLEKIMLVGLVFGYHSEIFSKISQWQIVQDSPGFLCLNVRVDNRWQSHKDEINIREIFIGFDVEITYDSEFIFTGAGKRPFLIQNIKA